MRARAPVRKTSHRSHVLYRARLYRLREEEYGLKRVCENYSLQMSPVGTAESSPGRESWVEVRETTSPAGTAENAPGCNPGVPPTPKWTISDAGRPIPGQIGLALDDCHS